MVENVEDLTITYEEGGQVLVEELDKAVLSKGAWSTVVFKYREWDRRKEHMGPVKFSLRRYRKRHGAYHQHAKFNISSLDQARGVRDVLAGWIAEEEKA